MKSFSLQTRLLVGRLLTRSGDQAWDFAVPIVLLQLFPGELRVAALYYLIAKILNIAALPKMSALIDRLNRLAAVRLGIALQFVGVLVGAVSVYCLSLRIGTGDLWQSEATYLIFSSLIFGGFLSSLGASFMDIAIANDLVPACLPADKLAPFNSRLRRLDLFTEVTSPVAAGLLLTIGPAHLTGFFIVALWNLISFVPELLLIQSILVEKPQLLEKKIEVPRSIEISLFGKLVGGWRAFFKEPIALAALAYAFLWLSVLSPHGVLLTGFLKDGWHFPAWGIGIFRAAGAVFGLVATVLYPLSERRWGVVRSARNFLIFQTFILLVGLCLMFTGSTTGQIGFLVCILLSRIGLYGFSLGEMQIRQVGIRPNVRGEVNGFATALTGIATLVLYASGSLLPATEDFQYLIIGSVLFVAIGCVTFIVWTTQRDASLV